MGSRIKSKDARSLSGYLISDASPSDGQVLKYNSSTNKYEPGTAGGGLSNGSGTVYDASGNAVDLGGTLTDNTTVLGAQKRLKWGDWDGNDASYATKPLVRSDVAASGRILDLIAQTSGSATGQLSDRTGHHHIEKFGDTSGVDLSFNPTSFSTYLHSNLDDKFGQIKEVFETYGSNAKTYFKNYYDQFFWQVFDSNGYKTEFVVNRTLAYINVFNSTGTGSPGVFYIRYEAATLLDGANQGIFTVPNGTYVGDSANTHFLLGTAAQDSNYKDGSTNKKGIRLTNFGESNADTAAGANYSTLVNTSLVPKKYVDDAVLAATDPNAIHKNASAEISTVTAKANIEQGDLVVIEDSNGAAFTKKSVTRRNFIRPVDSSQASTATLTCNLDVSDQNSVTALAAALTIAAPVGTLTNALRLVIRIKDDGTARALTWNAIFRVIGVTLPTTTTANKTVYIGCIYNSTDTKWDVVAVKQEA